MIKYRVTLPDGIREFAEDQHQQAVDFAAANNTTLQTITENETPPLESKEVPMWKLRIVLTSMGLIDSVNQLLEALPEPNKTAAGIAWEYGNTIDTQGQTIAYLQAGLGLTNQQVTDIFNTAEAITI